MNKSHKGGKVVRIEPMDMYLFETKPMAREVFQRVDASLSSIICKEAILR